MMDKLKLFVLAVLALPIVLLNLGGCGSGSSSGRVSISGKVFSVKGNSNAVEGIEVVALNPNNGKKLGSRSFTDANGDYTVKVPTSGQTRLIVLTFTTPDLEVFDEDFIIAKGSQVFLDVSLAGDGNVNIAEGNYQIISRNLSLKNNQDYTFVNALGITTPELADLTIDGNGKNCIMTTDKSIVLIGVRNFTMTNCKFGIRSTDNSIVTIDASEDFIIDSVSNGVQTQVNAAVFLSGVNTFNIEATSALFGISANNNSTVVANDGIEPPISCSVTGTEGSFIETDLASVEIPPNCIPLVVEPLES